MKTLTQASLNLLLNLVADSGNWSNNTMIDITSEERGNLTQLKKSGLLTTWTDEGIQWCNFQFVTGDVVTDGVRKFELKKFEYYSEAIAL